MMGGKTRVGLIAALGFALSTALLADPVADSETWYQAGRKAFKKRDFKRAGHLLLKAAQAEHKAAQKALAQMYLKGLGTAKDEAKGQFWLEKFRTQSQQTSKLALFLPDSGVPKNVLGQRIETLAEDALEDGNYQDALNYAETALLIYPTRSAQALLLQASLKLFGDDLQKAKDLFESLQGDGSFGALHEIYADYLLEKQLVAPAKDHYEMALYDPGHDPIRSYHGLARIAVLSKDSNAMQSWLQKAQELDPRHEGTLELEALIKQ